AAFAQLAFELFGLLVERLRRHRPLVAGDAQAAQDLLAVERLALAVLLDHGGQRLLDALVGGEAALAAVALPPAPGYGAARDQPRIDDPALHFTTVRALHGREPRRSAASALEGGEDQRRVGPAETEGVAHGALDTPLARLVGHEVQRDLGVRVF